MANILSSNVTYAVKNFRRMGNSKVQNRVAVTFGNGTLTYPAGGVPLLIGSMGCPNVVESASVVSAGTSGYVFRYNQATASLLMFRNSSSPTSAVLAEASSGSADAPASVTVELEVVGW